MALHPFVYLKVTEVVFEEFQKKAWKGSLSNHSLFLQLKLGLTLLPTLIHLEIHCDNWEWLLYCKCGKWSQLVRHRPGPLLLLFFRVIFGLFGCIKTVLFFNSVVISILSVLHKGYPTSCTGIKNQWCSGHLSKQNLIPRDPGLRYPMI